MTTEKNKAIKPLSPKELRNLYGLSWYQFNEWLKPVRKQLGKTIGGVYNINQVNFIFNHFGEPGE